MDRIRKYHGVLIYCTRDEEGPIEVIDDECTRSLHFGTRARQSTLFPKEPQRLALTYVRAMAASLLLTQAPRRVLLIGLGGGTLATFLLHHLPHCHIDALERRAEVIRVARSHFSLPDSPRLHIHTADGIAFIHHAPPGYGAYDLIFLDAYHAEGMEAGAAEPDFLSACRTRLAPTGLLVTNVWGSAHQEYVRVLQSLTKGFGCTPLRLPVDGSTNVILYALRHSVRVSSRRQMAARAKDLKRLTGLEYPRLMRALYRHNAFLFPEKGPCGI